MFRGLAGVSPLGSEYSKLLSGRKARLEPHPAYVPFSDGRYGLCSSSGPSERTKLELETFLGGNGVNAGLRRLSPGIDWCLGSQEPRGRTGTAEPS